VPAELPEPAHEPRCASPVVRYQAEVGCQAFVRGKKGLLAGNVPYMF
jgi:hypothetical protein